MIKKEEKNAKNSEKVIKIKEKGIKRKETLTKKEISKFVNIALATSKIKKITVEQKNGDWDLRTNINLFIYGEIGSTKSTLLNTISKLTNSKKPFTHLTFPALIGSIDKMTRQLIIGSCWECRNSLMLLDEFNFTKRNKDDIRALLQLIEGGEYNKKLASFSSPTKETDEDLSYSFENGEFNIKTRFSLIVVTMKHPYFTQNMELKALVSRSLCLPFFPEKKILSEIADGFPLFKFKEYKVEPEIIIKKIDYKIIKKIVDDKTNGINYLRIIGDCVRVFAVLKEHNEDIYNLIIKLGSKKFTSARKNEDYK